MEQAQKRTGGAHVLLSIQALRGFAVLGVVLLHIQLYFSGKLQRPDLLPQFSIGAAGIDLFFVISGFIMVYATERLFGQPEGRRIYFLRRIARIVPLYWVATTIMLVYVLRQYGSVENATGGAGLTYVICSYLFIPYGRPNDWGAPLLGVGWTLIFEMYFYTVFGLLVVWPRRAVVVTVSAFFLVVVALGQVFPNLPNPIGYWTHPLIIEFVLGMTIALAFRNGVRLSAPVSWFLLAAGLAVLIWSWRQQHDFHPDSVERVFVWGLPAFAIVAALALARRELPHNRFWRGLGFIGDASYSLYLFHALGLGVPAMFLGRYLDLAQLPWLHLAFIMVSAMLPGVLIYLYAEKPFTAWLQRKIERRRPAGAPVPLTATPPP